jgi:hypothetical protein
VASLGVRERVVERACGCRERVHYLEESALEHFRRTPCPQHRTDTDVEREQEMAKQTESTKTGTWVVLDWLAAAGSNPRYVAALVGGPDTDDSPVRVLSVHMTRGDAMSEAGRRNAMPERAQGNGRGNGKGKLGKAGKPREAVKLASVLASAVKASKGARGSKGKGKGGSRASTAEDIPAARRVRPGPTSRDRAAKGKQKGKGKAKGGKR